LAEDGAPSAWSKLRYAGQLRHTYLVCEDESGFFLLDQHAAAERVNFDRLKRAYLEQSTRSQALLFPALVPVSAEQRELVDTHASDISRLGFEIQGRTEANVSVHRVPALLQHVAPERLVTELLRELSRRDHEFSERLDLALATLACHGSLRAGQVVTEAEARALLQAMDDVEFSGHCPHGRPVVAFTPWSELERKVGRR
jgi:DNA mismatch repair protein MutL